MIRQSCAIWIKDHPHDVVNVSDFVRGAQPHLGQRVEACEPLLRRGWFELKTYVAEPTARPRGERPVLALEVMNDDRMWSRQESRDHDPAALSTLRWREDEDVRATAVTDVPSPPYTQINASALRWRQRQPQPHGYTPEIGAARIDQPCRYQITGICPACRAVKIGGACEPALPRDRDRRATNCGHNCHRVERLASALSPERLQLRSPIPPRPPDHPRPRCIDRSALQAEERATQPRLACRSRNPVGTLLSHCVPSRARSPGPCCPRADAGWRAS